MQSFELLGHWWPPEKRGVTSVAGRLAFSREDGVSLELHGALDDQAAVVIGSGAAPRIPVLQGVTEDGKHWTLIDSQLVGATDHFSGYPVSRYHSSVALRNVRYGSDTPTFTKVWLQLSRLSDWVGRGVWQQQFEFEEGDQDKRRQVHVRFENVVPPEVTVRLERQDATVRVVHGYSTKGGPGEGVILGEEVSLAIEVASPLPVHELYRRFVFPLQNFLTLATNRANSVVSLAVGDPTVPLREEEPDKLLSIDVFLGLSGDDDGDRRLLAPWMLFSLPQVESRLEAVLNAWFEVSDDLEVVCQLLFGQQYHGETLIDLTFLAYSQAIEGYHRLRFGGTPFSEEAYGLMVASILETCPDDHREWLQAGLQHANFFTFRDRLRAVYDYVEPVACQLGRRSSFVRRVADERNDITHPTERQRSEDRVEQLFLLAQALKIVLRACLLRDIGFTNEECNALFTDNQDFLQWRERVKAVLEA